MVLISNAKIDFLRFWLCTFWKNPGGSIRKNGKLTDHICFVYQAFFDGTGEKRCAEPVTYKMKEFYRSLAEHESNHRDIDQI